MNLGALTKEQKQLIFLGGLVGSIACYSLFSFVLAPMKKNWAESKAELGGLADKLEKADRMIANKRKLIANRSESDEVIRSAARLHIPDLGNPLSWATLKIYAQARDVGLDIRSVSEIGAPTVLVGQGHGDGRLFGAYAVRIETECSFDTLRQFLRALDASNPYASVSSLSIDARPDRPEVHSVKISLEWPAWVDAAEAEPYLAEKGDQHG